MNLDNQKFVDKYQIAPQDFLTRAFLSEFRPTSDMKILVLSCFDNNIAPVLSDMGCDVTGVGVRPSGYKKIGLHPFEIINEPVWKYRAPLNTFDMIVSFRVFQFMSSVWLSKEKGLDSAYALKLSNSLREGGRIFTSFPVGGAFPVIEGGSVAYTLKQISNLGFRGLKVTKKDFLCSNYQLSGGLSDSVLKVSEAEALKSKTVPYEMFLILKKN